MRYGIPEYRLPRDVVDAEIERMRKRLAEALAEGASGFSTGLWYKPNMHAPTEEVVAVAEPLRAAGLRAEVFSDTVPDPTDTVIEDGVAVLKGGDFDCLVGFGGGSPMDTAKAMAILAAAPEGTKMRAFKVPAQADRALVPVVCVPTTAGTGSEATRFTVITDTETDEKMLIAGLGALLGGDGSRGLGERVVAAPGLGEGDDVADGVGPGQ